MLAQIPNGLSALRFALAAVWIDLAARGHQGRLAFAIVAILAAGSDFIDGRTILIYAKLLNSSGNKESSRKRSKKN